jgi:GMP synthase (glutamine-hydrolysing)
MGDGRTYDYVVALRAVQTIDFMTAHWAHCRTSLLEGVATASSTRCAASRASVYDISGKPPATIEWE